MVHDATCQLIAEPAPLPAGAEENQLAEEVIQFQIEPAEAAAAAW